MATTKRTLALIGAAALALGAAALFGRANWLESPAPRATGPIALFTTLPLLWNEASDLAGMLRYESPPHWARDVLGRRGAITPLDTLTGERGLDHAARLVMAQPRPLSPDENVALDNWVRAGGKMLLFADPALTEDSVYPLGDRRRPLDVVLLSPILARWGLRLTFDEAQALGERGIAGLDTEIPVNLPGAFVAAAPVGGGAAATCRIEADGLVAKCRVGRGTVVALADVAVLERGDDSAPHTSQTAALSALLGAAFD